MLNLDCEASVKKYDVSIIVPVYNVENFIEKCATSLMKQDYERIEFIFVNDCTPDKSMEILQQTLNKYPNRKDDVKIIKNQQNSGSSITRQNGLNIASGEYVLFIDSDDWIEPDMVSKMYKKAKDNNADIVCCDMVLHYKNRQVYKKNNHKKIKKGYELKDLVVGHILPSMPNKLIKKELFNDVIFPKFQFGEDSYIMTQLFYFAKNITYISEPLFHYNKLNGSSLSTDISEKTLADIKDMYFSICEFLRNKGIYCELIKYHRIRLISVVFYNLDNNFIKHLKDIDKKSAKFWLVLQNDKFSLLQKLVCLLPFIGFNKLFKFIRDVYKR